MIGIRRNKITDEILKKEYKRFLTLKKIMKNKIAIL